jgi:hypothetical protein
MTAGITRLEKKELIEIILRRVNELAATLVKESKEYCEDYVKKTGFSLEFCLWRMKNQARSKLVEYSRELLSYVSELYHKYLDQLTQEERNMINRRLQEIVDTALHEMYPHEIHPIF